MGSDASTLDFPWRKSSIAHLISLAGALALTTGALGCGISSPSYGDLSPVVGIYLLESVDGQPLPASLPAQQGCTRTIDKGEFDLDGPSGEARPLYSWGIAISASCQPPGSEDIQDFGAWRFPGPDIVFSSQKGHGTYVGSHLGPAAEETRVRWAVEGHTYVFRRVQSPNTPTGILYLKFLDQTDIPVAGVKMNFLFPNGLEGGGTTPVTGEFGDRGAAGTWKITLVLPSGYSFEPPRDNPFDLLVPQGTTQLTIRLRRG